MVRMVGDKILSESWTVRKTSKTIKGESRTSKRHY